MLNALSFEADREALEAIDSLLSREEAQDNCGYH